MKSAENTAIKNLLEKKKQNLYHYNLTINPFEIFDNASLAPADQKLENRQTFSEIE